MRGRRLLGRAPRLAEYVLIAIIALLLARALMTFFAPLPVPAGDQLAALPTGGRSAVVVEGRNPFPAATVDETVVAAGPDLAETALDLTLTGVWPDAESGSAIIRRPDGEERRFAIGEDIVSGVRLIAVYSDQVVIEQNGVRESLRFESKAPVTRVVRQPQNQPDGPAEQAPEDKIKNAPVENLGAAIRLAPGVDPAGKPAVALFAGRDRAAFESIGLRDGDILRSINGAPTPTSPEDLAALMSQFMQTGAATLVVERDGAMETISLSKEGSGNG